MPNIQDYILTGWRRSTYRDANGSGFQGEDLPFPYTSPCIAGEGTFAFFFYWDTYFTNLGLLRCGHAETAKNNICNILWLIARQGYMPNHVAIANRSQPPYLCRMVEDYFAATGGPDSDPDFFRLCAETLRQEYHFWTTARHTPTGLQRHGHHETAEGTAHFYRSAVARRIGLPADAPDDDATRIGGHRMAEAETGWDFNPRFDGRCLDFNPADLNALLHGYEETLGRYAERLGWGDDALWRKRNVRRRELVTRYLWDESRGFFFDYDFTRQRRSEIASLAGYLPLFTGLATAEQAARAASHLALFEREHGIAVTEDKPGVRMYQWAFPNVWPPLVYTTVEGLRRYGFERDADRIAAKFLATTERLFEKTGQLWEKTDALTGGVAGGEYEAAPMMGWTAGIYTALREGS